MLSKKGLALAVICVLLLSACSCSNGTNGATATSDSTDETTQSGVLVERGTYYCIYRNSDDPLSVSFSIFDTTGQVFLEEQTSQPLKISMIDDTLVDIGIGAGTGLTAHRYFDPENAVLSQEYTYVLANSTRKVAYVEVPAENPFKGRKIVVRDVFDKTVLFREFPLDFAEVDTPVTEASFSEDGSSLRVSYLSGEDQSSVSVTLSF